MLAIYHKVCENMKLPEEKVSEYNIPEDKSNLVPPIKAMDIIWIKVDGDALYMLRQEFPIWGGGFAESVTLFGSIARTVYETIFHCNNPRELFQDMLINLRDA
jgi:hypothetical protein